MIKRIFRSIFLVALAVLMACLIIFLGVLYNHFTQIQQNEMRTNIGFIAQGVTDLGLDYLDGLQTSGNRITWVDTDGTVLFDSNVDPTTMENHANREEIISAHETGFGESVRHSDTLMEKQVYSAKLLPDNTVIRVSITQDTFSAYLILLLQPIIIMILAAILISTLLASRLSKQIVKPLNELDLEDPLDNDVYEEISPLLTRIEKQHRQIRKQMDDLTTNKNEFETITDSMTEGMVLINRHGTILSINNSATSLFCTDQRCVGRNILTVDRSIALQEIVHSAMDGTHAQTVMALKGGEYQIAASPIISANQISGVALLAYDITERRHSEQMWREFTANVSHELKTPLHSISGCAEIIKNGLVKPEDMPQFINQIYSESQRMITLVDDVIRLSWLDEQKLNMPKESINLFNFANQVITELAPIAQKEQISFSLQGEETIIEGVPRLIYEIIYNLCDNAIKYNCSNGQVSVNVFTDKNTATLCVTDTGIGISKEDYPRVFERFYRVDKSHSHKIGGTGLGLSIVKHAARLHNAKIDLQSEPGKGTTICIGFPL